MESNHSAVTRDGEIPIFKPTSDSKLTCLIIIFALLLPTQHTHTQGLTTDAVHSSGVFLFPSTLAQNENLVRLNLCGCSGFSESAVATLLSSCCR